VQTKQRENREIFAIQEWAASAQPNHSAMEKFGLSYVKTRLFFPDFAIALRYFKRKYRSCAQPWISVSSTFWYYEHIANSLGKIISYRSAFAFRSSYSSAATRWPQSCRVKITFTKLPTFRFHNKKIDEMRCKLDSTENPRSFEKYPTPPYAGSFEKYPTPP